MAMQYRDIAFDLYHQLHPPPGEGEMDTDRELADDGEPDQEPSDEEESDSGNCRRKLVGSLPWGMPTVVVYRQTVRKLRTRW